MSNNGPVCYVYYHDAETGKYTRVSVVSFDLDKQKALIVGAPRKGEERMFKVVDLSEITFQAWE